MINYISQEAVLDYLYRTADGYPYIEIPTEDAVNAIKAIPAADVVEVQYCRFSLEEARRRESVYKCSACGYCLTVRADTLNGGRADMNYCPFCGRKVVQKGKDGGQGK